MATLSRFGERLRAWRKRRGFSQLDLAIAANTTPRYVSFIETGRSRPGRGVVMRLSDAMGLSLRDRNELLVAAGLPRAFAESALDDAALGPVRRVVARVLENHEPYPAFTFGPGLRLLGTNRTGERLFPGMTQLSPEQLVDAWCTRTPEQTAAEHAHSVHQVVAMLRHELFDHPHPEIPALLARAEEHASGLPIPDDDLGPPVMCPTLLIEGRRIQTLSTVLRFDKPSDVTVSEMRVELVFPADEEGEAFFRELAARQ